MTGPARFPASGLWSIGGPLQDVGLLGVDLAARIAAGLAFGSLALPTGAVLYASEEPPDRFEGHLAEWLRYHRAVFASEVVHVRRPLGHCHEFAHHVREVGPAVVVIDSPPSDRLVMAALRGLSQRAGVPFVLASTEHLPGVPVFLRLERTEGRSGTITVQTGIGDRLVAKYVATASRDDRTGIPMLAIAAPESDTPPDGQKRPARAQAPIRTPRDGRTHEPAPATAASGPA